MIEKKTFVLAVAVSWVLTLVTVLLISNFVPNLTQQFTIQNVKVVNLQRQEAFLIRYQDDYYRPYQHLNFTLTPTNKNNNAILAVLGTFEYNIELAQVGLDIYVYLNRVQGHTSSDILLENTNGDWKSTSFIIEHLGGKWVKTNQDAYPIQLQLSVPNNQTYIRNVNLMLLVIDGWFLVSASSPLFLSANGRKH